MFAGKDKEQLSEHIKTRENTCLARNLSRFLIRFFGPGCDQDFKEKKQPIDYRRSGVLTLFVGIGLFLFGIFFIGILKGVGLLVGTIGVGSLIAGYLYPNESAEITKAVENFEKK